MQKQAPTAGRLLVMVGFALSCFGLLLFLWLAFGGAIPLKPKGYRFDVTFGEATQLAVEADVRISGVPVGKVKTVEPNARTGRSLATIQLEERFAPISRDTKAILRQKTLLGETYVELTPGDPRLGLITQLSGVPQSATVCPASSQAGGAGGSAPGQGGGQAPAPPNPPVQIPPTGGSR